MTLEVGDIRPLEVIDDFIHFICAVNNRRARADPHDVVGGCSPGGGDDLHVSPIREPTLGLIKREDAPLLAGEAAT